MEKKKENKSKMFDKMILDDINVNQYSKKKGKIFTFAVILVLALIGLIIFLCNGSNLLPTAKDYTVQANVSEQENESYVTKHEESTAEIQSETEIKEEITTETAEESTTAEEIIQKDWKLILANADNPLPEDFTVETTALKNGKEVDSRMYPYLSQMLEDANALGLNMFVCSAYRSYDYQKGLFERQQKIYMDNGMSEEDAYNLTKREIAIPGTSEHSTGLAVDIVVLNYQTLDEGFEKTEGFKWLSENAEKYGFILRYPKDKEDVTGIKYEPWHYRYVGEENAKKINELGICLEEYLTN